MAESKEFNADVVECFISGGQPVTKQRQLIGLMYIRIESNFVTL